MKKAIQLMDDASSWRDILRVWIKCGEGKLSLVIVY